MTKTPNRAAGKEEQDFAQHLVDEYRRLLAEGAFTVAANTHNPHMLLFALERFAKTGFLRPSQAQVDAVRDLTIVVGYPQTALIREGDDDAIDSRGRSIVGKRRAVDQRRERLAERLGVSNETIKRRLRRLKLSK